MAFIEARIDESVNPRELEDQGLVDQLLLLVGREAQWSKRWGSSEEEGIILSAIPSDRVVELRGELLRRMRLRTV